MSEQTPTTSEDLRGAEPSMEDILASIRKIISEDEPVALESPEDVMPVPIVTAEAAPVEVADFGDFSSSSLPDPTEPLSVAEGDSVDLNIDDVLADLEGDVLARESDVIEFETEDLSFDDLEIPEIPETAAEISELEALKPAVDEDAFLKTDEDILAFLDDEIELEPAVVESVADEAPELTSPEAITSDSLIDELLNSDSVVPENVQPEAITNDDDLEMDALLDDILLEQEEPAVDVVEVASPALNVEPHVPQSVASVDIPDEPYVDAEQSDLDLVKSLMADLSDDPIDDPIDEDLDALLEMPSVDEVVEENTNKLDAFAQSDLVDSSETVETVDLADVSDAMSEAAPEPQEDILGDILNMTLDDEMQGHPEDLDAELMPSLDDIIADEQDNVAANAVDVEAATVEALNAEVTEEAIPSLSEIAAAAEADAAEIENVHAMQPVAAATGVAAAGAAFAAVAVASKDDEADVSETEAILADVLDAETSEAEPLEALLTEIEAVEVIPDAVETEITTNSPSIQETSMPVKAVKTDAILDEVTEAATADVFAELNQVVEDKAVFNERGPRIGDLVQEALRPMLKDWLDANLKNIVERAVTKEVKRISSGK